MTVNHYYAAPPKNTLLILVDCSGLKDEREFRISCLDPIGLTLSTCILQWDGSAGDLSRLWGYAGRSISTVMHRLSAARWDDQEVPRT